MRSAVGAVKMPAREEGIDRALSGTPGISVTRPNILGNKSFLVHTYQWKAIYTCPERWPLEDILSKLDRKNYRITSNRPEETT